MVTKCETSTKAPGGGGVLVTAAAAGRGTPRAHVDYKNKLNVIFVKREKSDDSKQHSCFSQEEKQVV